MDCTYYPYRSTEYVSRTDFIRNTVQEQNTIDYFVMKIKFLKLFDKLILN